MNIRNEHDTQQTTPNLLFLTDDNGNHWYCEAETSTDQPLEGQACTPAEDWVYDRSFGG
jgi:hypothetical protein